MAHVRIWPLVKVRVSNFQRFRRPLPIKLVRLRHHCGLCCLPMGKENGLPSVQPADGSNRMTLRRQFRLPCAGHYLSVALPVVAALLVQLGVVSVAALSDRAGAS